MPPWIIENRDITPRDDGAFIQNYQSVILDVRTQEEYSDGHFSNSLNLDYYSKNFVQMLNQLDKNKTYLVYCESGYRTANTIRIMQELGFINVFNKTGGIEE